MMKINSIFLFIFILTVTPAWAQLYERPEDRGVSEPNGVARALPRWKSSLGDIQEAASALLSKNSALMDEYDRLMDTQVRLKEKMEALRVDNARINEEVSVRQKNRQGVDPSEVARLKDLAARHGKEIKARQEAIEAGKMRLASYEARLAVLRIQAQEADMDLKARDVDMKAHDAERIQAVIKEGELLRSRAAATIQQLTQLREKTAELERMKLPDSPEARVLASSIVALKERSEELSAMKLDLKAQLVQDEAVAAKAGADTRVKRVRELLSTRDALQVRIKENSAKLKALQAVKPGDFTDEVAVEEENFKKLERQNAFIEDEIGNLRENIALLEYKVATLERYHGRHNPPAKTK